MLLNEYVTKYEVNPLTMAILPKENENGVTNAYVLEETQEYIAHTTPTKMIDYACKFFGSSLRGRLDGTKDVSNITHKAPIAIDPSSGMYFFPTTSPANKNCIWIAHSHVDKIIPVEKSKTKIIFKNGKSIIVNVSFGSMQNQMQRTAQFRFSLEHRIQQVKNPKRDEHKDDQHDEE